MFKRTRAIYMFLPKTEKIKKITENHKSTIKKVDSLFLGRTLTYIDFANVRPWSQKLKFHIDIKRLKQFLDSFDQCGETNFYQGTLVGDIQSEKEIKDLHRTGYKVCTKPVKIMDISIDTTSLPSFESPDLLKDFIRKPFLATLSIEQINNLNAHLYNLNKQGVIKLQDRKCNFDVEMGVDMLIDLERNKADSFVIWSGDSDFADPIKKLVDAKKNVVLFGTAGRISKEINELRALGLKIFDIRDLREFICWPREMS